MLRYKYVEMNLWNENARKNLEMIFKKSLKI